MNVAYRPSGLDLPFKNHYCCPSIAFLSVNGYDACYCICCSGEQSVPKILDCCDEDDEEEDDIRTCEDCDREIHEDDAIWVHGSC